MGNHQFTLGHNLKLHVGNTKVIKGMKSVASMTQNVEAIESAGQMRSIGLSKRFDMHVQVYWICFYTCMASL